MSKRMGDSARMNGIDKIPRPFVIGVAGGTASGKVSDYFDTEFNVKAGPSRCNKITYVRPYELFVYLGMQTQEYVVSPFASYNSKQIIFMVTVLPTS